MGKRFKNVLIVLFLMLGLSAMAQQKIQLHPTGSSKCVKSDMTSLKATFSFSVLKAQDFSNNEGKFSEISLPGTVIGGNEGDPEIPVVNELIAVPVGATPRIEVKSYHVEEYSLGDYDIKTLMPRQPSLRKDKNPEDVPFVYNKANYQRGGLGSSPNAVVEVVGTMRGVRLGKMTIEPVSYDPVNNSVRVFNDIEVEVHFDGANTQATKALYDETYSPYFDIVYKQLFNGSAAKSAYTDHPDLYTTPVKMLVVTTSTFANSTPFQNWVTWKKQKGIDVDVQTVANNASAATIKGKIYDRYNATHPTFLVLVGDETVVTHYALWDYGSSYGKAATDLEYASVDGDVYHDMFLSRMPVATVQQLENLVNKTLTYEKYTMSDPSYLDNVLLIAGADGTWAPRVGRPTINYAANNYFNAAHGFSNVYKYVTDNYTGCYNHLNTGVGFGNYTAHGDIEMLADPQFTNDNANALTNNDKYFWFMGNCCLTANFKNEQNNRTCLGETLVRAANKGAFGYIGSVPESYWWEDYYFGVGAFAADNSGNTPTVAGTTKGVYDAMFDDTSFNTLNAIPFVGNLAVSYAHANGYPSSVSDEYYWRAYQCFGDGSVMLYVTQPVANTVSHDGAIIIGASAFTVNADAGSYVSITKDNEILGVAVVPATGLVNVPITGLTNTGEVTVVVTRQQRQPYIQTIQAIAPEGPYLTLDSYAPAAAHVGEETDLSLTFKNVGVQATTGATNVTLTPKDGNVTVVSGTGTFDVLESNNTTTVSGFKIKIAEGVADGAVVGLHYEATNGEETWEGDISVSALEAVLEYQGMVWDNSFVPGETLTVTAKFKNVGHYQATNAVITAATTSEYVTIANATVNVGTVAVDGEATAQFNVTVDGNCPETAQLPLTFTMSADGDITAQGNATLKNSCMVYFDLSDTYNDGWNGANLTVSFNDGTPSQNLTISSGNSANYALEIGNGVLVTLTWSKGGYDSECSFTVSYGEGMVLYQMAQGTNPAAGVLYQFNCNCAAATQTFEVTVASENSEHGTVSGGGEYTFGQTCTVTATPEDGYMFTGWFCNGNLVSSTLEYTFHVTNDMDLVAHFDEGILIGDGGSATNDNLPTNSYYNYSFAQQIYTVAELGAPGFIKSISFYSAGSEKTRNIDLYLKATTKNTFSGASDWVTVSADDKVFSGSVTFAADGWTSITFSEPFFYDGINNVVLVTDDNTGTYSQGLKCRVFNANNQALYVRSDGTNYIPGSVSETGTLLSVKNQLTLTKEAISTEPSTIKVSANPEGAGTVTGGGEYEFGQPCTVTATVNPGYYFTGWVENGEVVATTLEYSFTVTKDRELVATFQEGVMIGEGTKTNTHLPSLTNYKYSLTQQLYTADEIGIAGTINAISFYNGGDEKTRTFDLYLVHTDKDVFRSKKDWITATAGDKVFSGEVTMVAGDWTTITLNTPFAYDGTSNLAVIIDDNTGESTVSPHMACRVFDTDSKQSIYIHSNETDFDPLSPPEKALSNNNLNNTAYVKNQLFLNITSPTGTLELADAGVDNEAAIIAAAATDMKYDVTLTGRTLYKNGEWNTLCLPFDLELEGSILEGAIVKTLNECRVDASKVTLRFSEEPLTKLYAGMPYIVKWENAEGTIVNPVFEGVIVKASSNRSVTTDIVDFIGYYDAFGITAADEDIYYMTSGSVLRHTGVDRTLYACRAYFQFKNNAGSRQLVLDLGEGKSTSISLTPDSSSTGEGSWYTVNGMKLDQQPTRKGVYIQNGKKVVIK